MGIFPKIFWGAVPPLPNQCEGAWQAGGKGLSPPVDVTPFGPDRFRWRWVGWKCWSATTSTINPSHEAIDLYHHYKEDIAHLCRDGFQCASGCPSHGPRILAERDDAKPNEEA